MSDDTLLSARGLSLSFGAVPALVSVDADLWTGEVLAVVGESGAGKKKPRRRGVVHMVGHPRFELGTSCLSSMRSNQLS